MNVVHLSGRKRDGRHRSRRTGDDAESVTYEPIEVAARLAVEYAKEEAVKTGHVIHPDYAADLVTMFGEELRAMVGTAVSVVKEPLFVPFVGFTIPGNV